ncbi:hypothetical protein CMEL01_13014 [Colletotrichum melonis]|uniref:NACHT domain-containing protein n=1 Tax=Colletotrichum melonis TaxID=1209925 RepID=A0AAI9UY86_9PEZI|nr:hypothetical protein CMEL01_13014 [Colletotrichum melonis]
MGLNLRKKFKDFIRGPKNDDASQEPLRAGPSPRQQTSALAGKAPSSCTTDSSKKPQSVSATEPFNPPQEDTRDEPIGKLAPPETSEGSIRQLWDVAYQNLRSQEESLVQEFEDQICGNLSAGLGAGLRSRAGTKDWLATILKHKMDQVNRESWKLKFGSSEVEVQNVVKPALAVVDWANDFVAKALVTNPYASIAWSGVSLLLPLLLNPLDQAAALARGLEHISSLIVRSSMWEDLYLRRYESNTSEASSGPHAAYRLVLERLYREILKFQIVCYRYYNHKTASRMALDSVKHHDWEELLEQIKYYENEFDKVSTHVRDQTYTHELENAEVRHQQAMDHWENIGTDVSDLRRRVEEIQNDMERKELLDWLCTVDTSVQYNAARSKHRNGTCEWLIKDHKDFKIWTTSPKSFLWLNGKAGSGKSILSSSVIKYLKGRCEKDPKVALAYYFFSFGSLEQQKVTVMLSSLVRQLCASRPDTPQPIKQFEKYIAKRERPDIEALEEALIAAIRGFSAVYVVIDALDECPAPDGERSRLLDCFNRIVTVMPDNLHIFCTSRAEPDIDTNMEEVLSLPKKSTINLTEDRYGLDNDLRVYIDSALASKTYKFWPTELKTKAKEILIARADGMFQYLVCQFEVLQHLNSEGAILSALDDLPFGLDETYNRLLLSLDAAFQTQVLGSLKWLASSERPLSLEEFAEIFIFRPEAVSNLKERRLFHPRGVLRYFTSLVTTERVSHGSHETIIRLAHFTVKEYLVSDRIQQSRAKHFHFTEAEAHLHIAHCCLSYSLWGRHNSMEDDRIRSLEVYATYTWVRHLEKVPRTLWRPEVFLLTERAISRDSAILGEQRRPYCYTAKLGALELTSWLLREDSWAGRFVVQEDLDLALISAATGNNLGVVQFLLNKGAHATTRDGPHASALQIASSQGNLAIMEVLLNSGANIDDHDEESGSPLQAAARSLRFTALRMLVSRGADVRKTECILSHLLETWARFWRGRVEITDCISILQLFLENGVDINKVCTKHKSAFFWAIRMSNQEYKRGIVDFVLQQGAGFNLRCGRDPLQEACKSIEMNPCFTDSEAIVVIENLLSMGADVNAPAGEAGTALQILCNNYDFELNLVAVRLLLDKGADINQSGGHYGTALQAACVNGDVELVELLLDRGAEINQLGGRYGTALQAACRGGYLKLVELLLERGANCSAQGGEYGNALQAAGCSVFGNALKIAKKLLERGADVNASGGKFGSALQAAVSYNNRHVDLVSFLLSKGAEVNSQGGINGTALQGACAEGNMEAVRLLLDHGAEVNAAGGEYGTALQAACGYETYSDKNSGYDIARLLIKHGAEVHAQGGKFGSAWHAAATIGGRETSCNYTLKLLLDHGVDINDSRGRQHGTALQAALELFRSTDIIVCRVRFLLEHGADVNLGSGQFGFPLQSTCVPVDFLEGENRYRERRTCIHGLTYLLDNCPEINVNNVGGLFGTALQAAVYTDGLEDVELLLKKGANTNIRGGKYRSALNAAIFKGFWDTVKILLDAGAIPDCHQLLEPDEEWLECIGKEHGKGAVDRYKRFWEIMKLEWREGEVYVVKKQSN